VSTRSQRALAYALFVGALSAGLVVIISVLLDAPRLWPGFLIALVTGSAGVYLSLTRGAR
jgi:hypothetical protein